MLRRTIVALLAATPMTLLAPDIAAALGRGGGGGGGAIGGGGGGHGGGGLSAAPMSGGTFHGGPVGSGGAFRGGPVVGGGAFRSAPVVGGRGGFSSATIAPGGAVAVGARGAFVAGRHFGHGYYLRHHHHFYPGYAALAFWPYGYYPDYYSDYYYESGCYLVNRRVHTRHGWRVRPVEVCY